ncbi:MAG: response regulator [Oscillospiraceae bacterium]
MNELTEKASGQEQAIKRFLRDYLDKPKNEQTFHSVLADIGSYYDADRAYIFELSTDRAYASNTFEWCRDGVSAEIGNLQEIPVAGLECWFEEFEEEGEFFISSLSEDYGPDSKTYQILAPQGIESLMAAPMVVNGAVVGFLGVDNPRKNTGDLLLLSVVASTCYSEITTRRMMDSKIEKTSKALLDRTQIIQSMSEIYTSVYYIDLATGHFTELSSLDDVHTHIGASGDAQERLNYFCRHMVTPEFTDELLAFVELSTLEERLMGTRIISQQYRSTLFSSPGTGSAANWSQCSFIEGDRDDAGRLAHVIFATQSIHDTKVKELEAQRKLQQTNKDLTALLAAEKQNTAIIGALSNVFFALYCIDLEENTFQELISLDKIHHTLGEKGDAREALKHLTNELVGDAHKSLMRNFTDFDTIDARLGNKPIIIQEYVARVGGWTRCAFFPVERDGNGKNRTVLCTLRWITAEKEKMESQDNLIQALAIPYENIYAVNADTCEAVCYRMGQTMNDRYGQKFAAGNYEQNIRTYIENDVLEEDRHLFDRVRTVSGVNDLLTDKKTYYFNYRVFRSGHMQYFQCQLVKPSSERNEFVVGFKNIDEEKQQELAQQRKVEEALSVAEKLNVSLQEETTISSALSQEYSSLFKIDAKSGEISLYRTDGVESGLLEKLMTVGDYETVLSRYIDAFVVPEDRERLKESGKLAVLLERVPDIGLYKQGYRRIMGGVISYYEMNVVKTVDKSGKITLILGMRDVDEEMRRQLKQTREMEVQREIIEGLGSEYYSVLLVDPETDTVIPYRAEDDDGRAIAEHFRRHENCWSKGLRSYSEELISEESRSEFIEKLSLKHIQEDGTEYSFTYEKLTDGGIIYLQARVSFVHEKDGSLVAVVGTRNVDDLIKKERQQEMALQAAFDAAEAANKAKTDFLSNMSHDIRTPMNGIIGMTAIAMAHLDDRERVQDSLQKITQASKHLLSLINEVLDMSKIESGKVELVEEEFNLSDLVDNLLSMTSSQIEAHRHELCVNISGVTHEAVVGDSLRIQKVFTNLMSNAVKYTPDGGKIQLFISEKPSNQAKVGCYEFVFEDNGIGMSEEFLERIFDPFSRAADGRVNKIQGTGLGMPISRNIVRMMGGDIKVESTPGVGSRFTVTMYLKLQDTAEVQFEKFIDLDVLVADDDALSLESCCGMLNDLGMKAEGVSTGAEAVEQVVLHHQQKRDYFACIIDWKMPDMDGIATTRAIRRAVGNDVPIIIISAYDWSDVEQEARAAGANAFISKPLFRSRLAKTFSALVGEEEHFEQETPHVELENMDLTGRRVLLVEDNELNAEIAAEILGMTGVAVEFAADGTQAVDLMFNCPDGYYDMIFMDIQMPKMNGYDATRAIRAIDRNYCKQVPIVAMTANAFAEDVHAAKTVGMNEHIAKPLDLNALARTLNKWLL